MDKSEDVERLFSWIRAPMVRYREFAPQVEVAEAVATWPLVHKAAVETGVTSAEEAVPHGDQLAHQRLARLHMGMPELAAKAIQNAPPPRGVVIPEANEPHAMPSSDRLVAALGQRVQAARADRAQGIPEPQPEPLTQPAPRPVPAPQPPLPVANTAPAETKIAEAEPALSGFEEAAAPPEPGPRRGMPLYEERPRERGLPPAREQAAYQPPDRSALFHSDNRAIEREAPPPAARPTTRQDSSLGAVFNRLSATRDRDRLPDPRNRSRTTPGLGGVFDRLR